MFSLYLQELLNAQSRLVKDGLCKDYVIIYDYLMEILEKDNIVGPFVVKKKQQVENINADIVLDFTKEYQIKSFVREPFLCLTLKSKGSNNTQINIKSHPFFNENKTLISYRITQGVWSALDNGFSEMGVFVRGHRDDIYELTLSQNKLSKHYVKVYAHSEDIDLQINIRILIQHTINFQNEPKPFPNHKLKQEWLAKVPLRRNFSFDVCMPLLEKEIRSGYILIVMLQRLLKHFFNQQKHLYLLNDCFLESAIYGEFLDFVHKKMHIDYFFKGVIIRIQHRIKNGRFNYVFNTKLNLLNIFDNQMYQNDISLEINDVRHKTDEMRYKQNLPYEDFFKFLELKMEHDTYQVDEFGIFKSF